MENKSHSLALLLQLGRLEDCEGRLHSAMKCGQPKRARLLSPVIEALSLSRSLSLILSFEKERGLEDRSRSLAQARSCEDM